MEEFVRQTIMMLHQLETFARNQGRDGTRLSKMRQLGEDSFTMHLEDHMSFRYCIVDEKLEFFVNPIKIHKIMDVELNPIKYYGDIEMFKKLMELATIGAFHPNMIEKYIMENL